MSAIAEENRQLKLQNLQLLEQMAQMKADRDFVWSLWRRLQLSTPDVTGAVSAVMQREKAKLDSLEQSFAQRLAASETRVVGLDTRMRELERENAQLKEELRGSDGRAQVAQKVADTSRDESNQLRIEILALRSDNVQLQEELDRLKNEATRLRSEVADADFVKSQLTHFDRTVSELRVEHERELDALKSETAQVRLELELKSRECECLVEDLRQQVDLTEQIQRFYDAAQRDAVVERERFTSTLAERDAQLERAQSAIVERDTRLRQVEQQVDRLSRHLDVAARRIRGQRSAASTRRSGRSASASASSSHSMDENDDGDRFFQRMDTVRERERERRDRAITEMFAEIRGVRDRIDELERCAERNELGASQIREARDRLLALERRTEQLATANAALREENLDLLFAARSLERRNEQLAAQLRDVSSRPNSSRVRSRLDRSAPPTFLTSSSISGSENDERLERSFSGRLSDPLFQLGDGVQLEVDHDGVAAINASRRALGEELRRVRAQLVRRQLELDTARRQVATLRAHASKRHSRFHDVMAARSTPWASVVDYGTARARTRSVPATLRNQDVQVQEEDFFERFAFPDLGSKKKAKAKQKQKARVPFPRARSAFARAELKAIGKHIDRLQPRRRSTIGAPFVQEAPVATPPATSKRASRRSASASTTSNGLRQLEARCARQRDEIAALRQEVISSRNETNTQKEAVERCRADLARLRVRYRVLRNMNYQLAESSEPRTAAGMQQDGDIALHSNSRSRSRSPTRASAALDSADNAMRSGDHIDGRFDVGARTPLSNAARTANRDRQIDRDSVATVTESSSNANGNAVANPARDRELRDAKAEARRFAKQNLELRSLSVALKSELAAKREAENELRARVTRLEREVRAKRDTITELRRKCDELSQRLDENQRAKEQDKERERGEEQRTDKDKDAPVAEDELARRRATCESQARQLEVLRAERASLKSALEAAQRSAKDMAAKQRATERRTRSARECLTLQLSETQRVSEQRDALVSFYRERLATLSRFLRERVVVQMRRFADAFQRACGSLKGHMHRALDALATRDEQVASTRAQLDAVARANRQLETLAVSSRRRETTIDDSDAMRAAQKKASEILRLTERDVEQLLSTSHDDSASHRRPSPRCVDRSSLRSLLQTPYDDSKWLDVVGTLLDSFERTIAMATADEQCATTATGELHAEQLWQVLDMATGRLQNLVDACNAALT